MNKERLSDDEISNLFENYKARRTKELEIESYRNYCPHYNIAECASDINLGEEAGCKRCMKNKTYDLNNAEPIIGTKEYNALCIDRDSKMEMAVNKCKLSFDDKYCRYKNTFNYCSLCSKVFRREGR